MADRAVLGNIPAETTSFIGRRREVAAVRRLLAESRLVTLTGVGGAGKTRLALRVAAGVQRAFPGGVWFVDLTLTRHPDDPQALADLVAATLGLRDQNDSPALRRLAEHFAERKALLVLDNCEHLLPASTILADTLLRAAAGLRVLATSREPLAAAGETIFPVPSMPTPDPHQRRDPAVTSRSEAVELFIARAQAATHDFALTAENQTAIAELCRQVDGLPLAIELAAARVRTLAPQQILDRLVDRFTLLSRGPRSAPARQQTLRACVDWSFELCSKPERTLWARLSVFEGGFELDAVEGICADEALPAAELLDCVTALVDKSILVRDDIPDGAAELARYRLLDTIGDFGRDKLADWGEQAQFQRRHRDWYAVLVEQAAAQWIGSRQTYWHARLSRAHPNLRAAIEYSLTEPGQAPEALRLAGTLPGLYWWASGLIGEGRRWLDMTLAQAPAPTAIRARALLLASQMATAQGDDEAGERLLREGTDLARRVGGPVEIAFAGFVRGVALLQHGEAHAAMEVLESAGPAPLDGTGLATSLRLGRLNALAMTATLAGDLQRAESYREQLLAITEELDEQHLRSYALWGRALAAWSQDKVDDTMTSVAASLRLKQAAQDPHGAAQCVEMAAWVAAARRRHRRAATLLGAASGLRTRMGALAAGPAYTITQHEQCVQRARAGLGEQAFAQAFADGQAMSYDDAVAYTLDEPRQAQSPPVRSTPLTSRERQIAGLLAQGLSNKEIAARLVISQRTVESHVERILAKLDFTSRTQVAAWVTALEATDP